MSDDPSRYQFGVEEPIWPVIVAAILTPVSIIGFAIALRMLW